jgi:hypothetical protein
MGCLLKYLLVRVFNGGRASSISRATGYRPDAFRDAPDVERLREDGGRFFCSSITSCSSSAGKNGNLQPFAVIAPSAITEPTLPSCAQISRPNKLNFILKKIAS